MLRRHSGLDLLPSNSTAWERAISLTSAEREVPTREFVEAFNPDTCPARLLPWLATVFSVDVWFDEWPEARKRDVIRRAIELHRLKGTLAGFEAYLALVDCGLPLAVTPPSLFFASDFDEEHYARWLRSLPEIRVYHWTRQSAADLGGALGEEPEVLSDAWFGTDAIENYCSDLAQVEDDRTLGGFCLRVEPDVPLTGLRAILIEEPGGPEIELDIESENEFGARPETDSFVERLFFPEHERGGFYASRLGDEGAQDPTFADDAFATDGSDRQYAAFIRRGAQRSSDIGAPAIRGREVVDDDPVRVFPEQEPEPLWFLDDPNDLLIASDRRERIFSYYDSWRLVDRSKGSTNAPAYSFLDFDRFSIPPYTAELVVDFTETAPADQWFLDNGPIGFVPDSSFEALWNICDVVNVVASVRDDVLIDLDFGKRRSLRQLYSFFDLVLR